MASPEETVLQVRKMADEQWRRQVLGLWLLALLIGATIPSVAALATVLLVQPTFSPRLMVGPALVGLIASAVVMRANLPVIFGLPLHATLCVLLGAAGLWVPVVHEGLHALLAIGPLAGFTIAGTAIIVASVADR
ncbi:MAG: hypothetical protein H0W72_16265 [Planctomycetes bacterium]|nr:hypothetical protein [Planctomycetota bacterium]